jgi:hypothetical protein
VTTRSRDPTARGQPLNRAEFEKQLTEELRNAVLQFARRRMALVRRAGGRVDQLYARELLQDALSDTWMGTAPWIPAQRSLLDHVRGLIRHRSWKDSLAARRRPHLSIGADDEISAAIEEMQSNGIHGSVDRTVLASVTAAVIADLRRLAAGDTVATSILDAWEDGVVERRAVMERTGLNAADYKVGRARLSYLIPSLPDSLRQTARTLLRIVS